MLGLGQMDGEVGSLGVGKTLPFTEVFTQCSGFLPGLHTEITHGALQICLLGLQSW